MLYTDVNAEGMIHRRLYTDNPDAAVLEGHRLVADEGPRDLGIEASFKYMVPIEPVPINATKIEYKEVLVSEEIIADKVRYERNSLLADSDWTQLIDSPLSAEEKQKWAAYRQALRDVPLQSGFPYEVTMPKMT